MPKRRLKANKDNLDDFWRFGEGLIESGVFLTHPIVIDEESRKKIYEFANQKNGDQYTVYEQLPKMVAPYIAGNEMLKLSLCYSLASSPDKPVHLLMIGNPASVKSDMLSEAQNIFPSAVLGGPRSTEAGLTINSTNGSPGLLLRANKGIALIDEFDKIQKSEINSTYEALENGKIAVNTGKFKGEYPTKFVAIAAANPKDGKFANIPDKIRRQIVAVIPPPLLSRFHLIFILKQESREETEDAITQILTRKEKSNPNWKFLHNYFNYIKNQAGRVEYDFEKGDPLVEEMSRFVVDALEQSENEKICYSLTKRFAEGLKRISISSARLRLSNRVEEIDIKNAMHILKASLDTAQNY